MTFWGRDKAKTNAIADDLSTHRIVSTATDLRAACETANVIVTTTGATQPLIAADWIRDGTHITAVGADAPGKAELAASLIERADLLVADSTAQCLDHGEFSRLTTKNGAPVNPVVELGSVLSGTTTGRSSPQQITIADLTGIAAQDIAIAKHVLQRLDLPIVG